MADERYIDMMLAPKRTQEAQERRGRLVPVVGFGQYAPDRYERQEAPEPRRVAYA